MDMGLEGIALVAALTWEPTEGEVGMWTARRDGRLYLMTAHREQGRCMMDVSCFLRSGELLREWRWTLGSTFDKLPDSQPEGTA